MLIVFITHIPYAGAWARSSEPIMSSVWYFWSCRMRYIGKKKYCFRRIYFLRIMCNLAACEEFSNNFRQNGLFQNYIDFIGPWTLKSEWFLGTLTNYNTNQRNSKGCTSKRWIYIDSNKQVLITLDGFNLRRFRGKCKIYYFPISIVAVKNVEKTIRTMWSHKYIKSGESILRQTSRNKYSIFNA